MNLLPDLSELIALRYPAATLSFNPQYSGMGRLYGQQRSRQRGRGLEFEEVRPYIAGDDVRHIDWRVTARRGRAHTRLYREEKNLQVWVVCNLDSSMFFGSGLQLKSTLAVRLAALLCWIAHREGHRTGLLIHSGNSSHLQQTHARQQGILPLLQLLVERQPVVVQPPSTTAFSQTLKRLVPLVSSGSLLLLLSDWLDDDPELASLLTQLHQWSHPHLLSISDPLERHGLPNGHYALGIPGAIQIWSGQRSRVRWPARWLGRQQQLQSLCTRLQLPLQQFSTTDNAATGLTRWLRPVALFK